MTDTASPFSEMTLGAFSRALSSAETVPGGGSASAVAAALAAALVTMVARLSQERPAKLTHVAGHARAIEATESARTRLLALADDDAAAYAAFAQARRLPRETPAQQAARSAAVNASALRAAEVPLAVVRTCHGLVDQIEVLVSRSTADSASNLDVAALLAEAAARGAGANILVNLHDVDDQRLSATLLSESEVRLHEIRSTVARIHGLVRSRGARSA